MADVTYAPWRIRLNPTGNGPYAVPIKLIDYLYEGKINNIWVPRTGVTALGLPHDIIVYNPSCYGSSGAFNPAEKAPDLETRQVYGLYIAKITYDARAKPVKHVISSGPYRSVDLDTLETFEGFYEYTLSAALPPQESDFTTELGFKGDPTYATSMSVGEDGVASAGSSFCILGQADRVLEASLAGTQYRAYTRMRLNSDVSTGSAAKDEIAEAIQFFTRYGLDVNGSPLPGYTPLDLTDLLDPDQNPALNYLYVWFRCSYFADYVQPTNFNQDLTEVSEVKHKNIIVGNGDFRRFSRGTVADPETVKPYIPTTTPRNDLLTGLSSNEKGSFPIPSKTGNWAVSGSDRNTPFGWYDPDVDATHVAGYPAIPVAGNFYTSGRIFSPTVDELWVYVKKLVDGRIDDSNAEYSPAANLQKLAGPRASSSNKTITADTRLPAEPAQTLGSKVGDPLTADGTSFVNAPEGIQYAVNANIKFIADKITGTDGTASRIDSTAYFPFATHSSDTGVMLASRTRINHSAIQTTGDWAPRAYPLSLRELEGLVRNCQYNLELVFNFLAANKVSTGNTDYTPESNPQGTLYQLHVDYSPDLDNAEAGVSSKWVTHANTQKPSDNATSYGAELTSTPDTTAGTYDRLANISQQDIYLSAEGKWRYLFDHVRLPVLDETY